MLENLYLELNTKINVIGVTDRDYYQDRFNWMLLNHILFLAKHVIY